MRIRSTQGFALSAVLMSAVVFSIASFAALIVALSSHQRAKTFSEDRLRASFAAEAGIVWAMQRLSLDPMWWSPAGYVGPPSDPALLDTDADGIPETQVDVILPACPGPAPCWGRQLSTRVCYNGAVCP